MEHKKGELMFAFFYWYVQSRRAGEITAEVLHNAVMLLKPFTFHKIIFAFATKNSKNAKVVCFLLKLFILWQVFPIVDGRISTF